MDGRLLRLWLVGVLVGVSGCSGCVPAAELSLIARGQTVFVGDEVLLVAHAKTAKGKTLWQPEAVWSVSPPELATAQDGVFKGLSPGLAEVSVRVDDVVATATITVLGSTRSAEIRPVWKEKLQTMRGWEVTTQAGQAECKKEAFARYHEPVYDRATSEVGINRVRLEFRSNSENPIDWWTRLIDGEIDYKTWMGKRYASINDNDDPSVAAEGRFHFSELDHSIEHMVRPLQRRVEARRERLFINLCLVDFKTPTKFTPEQSAEEYAELVTQAFLHLREKHGLTPDALELILEPDVADGWQPKLIGPALLSAKKRLGAHGFRPELIGPSNTDALAAVEYFKKMRSTPGAVEALDAFVYHRYSNDSIEVLRNIGRLSVQFGLPTEMLEHMGARDAEIHEDIEWAQASSWSPFGLAYCAGDNGGQVYVIDQTDPTKPVIQESKLTPVLKRYFRWIREGAVRVQATSSLPKVHPLAFINTSGKRVLVIRSEVDAEVTVTKLPPGRYGVSVHGPKEPDMERAPVRVKANGQTQLLLHKDSVVTLHEL